MTVALVWISGLIFLSSVPDIAFRLATGASASPVWLSAIELVLLVGIFAAVRAGSADRGLRGYALTLVALAAGYLVESLIEHSSLWVTWNRSLSPGISFVLINTAKLIPVAALSVSLLRSGLSRQDLFIAIGDLRARFMRIGSRITVSWGWLLPAALLLSVGPVIANVVAARHPDFGTAGRLLTMAPLILAGAAINTLSEEFLFRQVLLARLIPLIGAAQAVWLTSLRFGFGHWFGNPSGPEGVLLAVVFGWFAAQSMVDTCGSGWAWLVHLVNDVVIFSLIALTTARWA